MKKIVLTVLAVFLTLFEITLAQHSAEEKKGSSMQDMMREMMKQKQTGEGAMGGVGGMMGMMKMMEQCSDMMKSVRHQADKTKESQKK